MAPRHARGQHQTRACPERRERQPPRPRHEDSGAPASLMRPRALLRCPLWLRLYWRVAAGALRCSSACPPVSGGSRGARCAIFLTGLLFAAGALATVLLPAETERLRELFDADLSRGPFRSLLRRRRYHRRRYVSGPVGRERGRRRISVRRHHALAGVPFTRRHRRGQREATPDTRVIHVKDRVHVLRRELSGTEKEHIIP